MASEFAGLRDLVKALYIALTSRSHFSASQAAADQCRDQKKRGEQQPQQNEKGQ